MSSGLALLDRHSEVERPPEADWKSDALAEHDSDRLLLFDAVWADWEESYGGSTEP